jgi:dTDP-4-amino-4,6-dideoxygalactose transaminase
MAIDAAMRRVLDSGRFLQGHETEAFEAEFASYLGVNHSVATGSGTDALVLGLKTLGIGAGDAVATVSHTATATVAAIDLVGALPILVDVDSATYCMDPARLEAVLKSDLGPRVRAVIPVHLYGHPAAMCEITRIAERWGIRVLEDCAQSHGAELHGRKTGGFGSLGAFSFYPTKNLGALGDGGALVTDDACLAARARCLKQYGWRERYVSHLPGLNTRIDELQAAVLRVKLPHLDAENARRRRLAGQYAAALAHTTLELPVTRDSVAHVFHQYVVQCERRDALGACLEAHGLGAAVHYPTPVHLQPGYRDRVALGKGGLGRTERLCGRIISLPMHPYLTEKEVASAAEVIAGWHEMEHP